MSAGAYEEELREVREAAISSSAKDALTRAFMTCQEHEMHVAIASEMIWGIANTMCQE